MSDGWVLVTTSFVCTQRTRVAVTLAEKLKEALLRSDAGALYALDREFVPFWCPQCQKVYCGECWQSYNVFDDDFPLWLDEVRGWCPHLHERMLVD